MAERPARSTAYLVYRLGEEPERVVIWDTVDIKVGRRKSMDIVVGDAEVSREHAIFERRGERYSVRDLGTGIGTTLNGDKISESALEVGDVVGVGRMTLRFGRTDKAIRTSEQIRYASQLKGGGLPNAPAGEGGRTMLAFEMEDDLIPSRQAGAADAAPARSAARAFSLDGTIEESEEDEPLGLSLDTGLSLDAGLQAAPVGVRNLDEELEPTSPTQTMEPDILEMPDELLSTPAPPLAPVPARRAHGAPPAPPVAPVALRDREELATREEPVEAALPDAATTSTSRGSALVEIQGERERIASLLAALDGKTLHFDGLEIRLKKLGLD